MKSLFTNKKLLISLAIVPVIGTVTFISLQAKPTTENISTLESSIEPKLSAQESLDTKPHKEDVIDQATTTKETVASVTTKVSTDQVTHPVTQATNTPVPDTKKAAVDNRLSEWEVQILDEEKETLSALTLNVTKISDTDIEGDLCYLAGYGNRIDCEINFYGKAVNDDTYTINFTSSFEQLKGQATITFKDDSLLWNLDSFPENDSRISYPSTISLTKNNDDTYTEDVHKQDYVITSGKAAIYSKPTDNDKTSAYFIQGDVVTALQQKEGWIAISYKKDTKTGWLKMNDVAEQLHE